MSAITWGDVVAIAAQLAALNDTAQTLFLNVANNWLDVNNFPPLGEDDPNVKAMRVFIAAHLGTVGMPYGGLPGLLTGEGELDLSISYSIPPPPPGVDPFWQRTGYGQAYAMMLRATPSIRLGFVL